MAVSIASQVLSPIFMLIGTFIFGITPIAVTRTLLRCDCTGVVCKPSCRARKGKFVTAFLVFFGGGVLLATCLVHLLPEAREGFEHYEGHHHDHDDTTEATTILSDITSTINPDDSTVESNVNSTKSPETEGHKEEFSIPEFIVCLGFFAVYLVEEIVHYLLGSHGHSHVPHESRAIRSLSRSGSCPSARTDEPSYIRELQTAEKGDANITCASKTTNDEEKTGCFSSTEISLTGLLTLVALSFHSVFEGFAIGIQDTDGGVWILFAAVSVHKFVIAFVVGLEVLTGGGKDILLVIYMAVFAGMSPLGMIIAFITQASVEENDPLLVGILNAIATGTLLYVTFCEILQREEENKNLKGWQQFVATLLGFGVMCLVQYGTTLA